MPQDALARFDANPEHSYTLPGSYYHEPEVYDREMPAIFHRTWQYACHVSLLAEPGDYFVRDIGDNPRDPQRAPVNRDTVWFSGQELQGWLPDAKTGAEADVSPRLLERLARFVFVDNVRGQTLPYARAELQGGGLRSKVLAIRGSFVDIEITGHSKATAKGPWIDDDNYWKPNGEFPRFLSCEIFGNATFDRDTERFTSFELVATGERQGRTTFNGRAKDEPDSIHQIGFLLQLADESYRVAPTFINMYGVKWVAGPKRKSGPR